MFQTISMRQLESLMDQGGGFVLLDVREPEEFAGGHLEGAVNLPLADIRRAPEFFSRECPVIVYCAHGGNSIQAARELDRMGYRAVNAYGGLSYYRGRHFREEII